MRILFADDEAHAYKIAIQALKNQEHEVLVSSREATSVLRDLGIQGLPEVGVEPSPGEGADDVASVSPPRHAPPYHLLILDIMMPPGEQGAPGGVLEGHNGRDGGLGVYAKLQDPAARWSWDISRLPVLVFTADNKDTTLQRLLELSKQGRVGELVVEYKPWGDVVGQAKRLLQEHKPEASSRGED